MFDAPQASTRRAAGQSIASAINLIENRILDFLRQRGSRGSTSEEAAEELRIRIQTSSARFSELGKARRIIASGTRATSSGRLAVVWISPKSQSGGSAA